MTLHGESVPEDLMLKLVGNVTADNPFMRMPLFEELVSTLPKDPKVKLLVYHGEVWGGGDIPWHIHNGPLLNILIQGELIFQLADEAFHYKAGDVFIEPVGVIHRGYNPNPKVTTAAVCVQITPLGSDHVVNIGSVPTLDMPLTAPQGSPQPKPRLVGRLEGD